MNLSVSNEFLLSVSSQINPLSIFATIVFLGFAWAVRMHFRSACMPQPMKWVSALSVAAQVTYLLEIDLSNFSLPSGSFSFLIILGFLFHLGAAWLFWAALRATRARRVTLAFDSDEPTFLVDAGPYRWIRHPFYLSYIFFWLGCFLQTLSLWCALWLLVLAALYVQAAKAEEDKFASSSLSTAYAEYRRRTGAFLPRMRGQRSNV